MNIILLLAAIINTEPAYAEVDIPFSIKQRAIARFDEESPAIAQYGVIPEFKIPKKLKVKILVDNTPESKILVATLNDCRKNLGGGSIEQAAKLENRMAAVRDALDITYSDYLTSLVSIDVPAIKVGNFAWQTIPKMKYREYYVRLFEYIIEDYWYEEYCQKIKDVNPVRYGNFDGFFYEDIQSEMIEMFIKILREELDKDSKMWSSTAYIYQGYYYIKYDDAWNYYPLSDFFDRDFHEMSIPYPDRPKFPDFELKTGILK